MQRRSRRAVNYEITPPPDEDRDIVIEEERMAGWTPASDLKGVEETPTRFRYRVAAPKGKTTKASFVTEHLDSETVVLTDLGVEEMLASIRQLQNESPRLKDTVAKLGAILEQINKAKVQRRQLENERNKIVQDQTRIRSNLQSVGQGSDLGRRYLDTLKTQEDRLAEIAKQDGTLEADIAARSKAAEDVARQLTL